MYAGVLIDELIKQVESAERNVFLQVMTAGIRNGLSSVSSAGRMDAHSNHFSGSLAAESGATEAIRPHGEC
jgi:hypothetical protein